MSLKIVIYQIQDHHRSEVICHAMLAGIRQHGGMVDIKYEHEYKGVEGDVALFYGLDKNTPKIFKDYKLSAKAIYVDLGYWGRRHGGRWTGYHKMVVNDRHPTEYFQKSQHDDSKVKRLGVSISPWRTPAKNAPILLAGMGDKGANAEGFEQEEWERWAIKQIREVSARPIIYRPKPSWKRARPIKEVGYSDNKQDVFKLLPQCHSVVTHHSNVAVDGLIMGIPAFCFKGVALPLSKQNLHEIESPLFPDNREQWANDVSWCQWSIGEMKNGVAWQELLEQGVLQ